jgi:hypothetical protein
MSNKAPLNKPTAAELDEEIRQFQQLKQKLPAIWDALHSDLAHKHTSVIVPSLSVNQEELAKVSGASFYEERLLFALIRLRNPKAHLVYLTSQPVHPEVVDYYLQMLDGVTVNHARRRLHMLSVQDASARPLTEKLLERPRLIERIKALIHDPDNAYLTCYNSTPLERRLAVELGIPLNGLDPDLLHLGTKSGNRRIFAEAGIAYPAGFDDLESEAQIVDALLKLAEQRPNARRAVIKLNEGFGGEGNGVLTFPGKRDDPVAMRAAMDTMAWTASCETIERFLGKFSEMGGIVEEFVDAIDARSPSVQMRIFPDGHSAMVSSHEQVLGGATGQSYLGCRFPADDDCRHMILAEAQKVATVLSQKGVLGRFAVDFLVFKNEQGQMQCVAIEINLRMGGTTPPFHALEFLTGGRVDAESGLFFTPTGQVKYYCATDNLKSPTYRGLLPEDLFEIIARRGVGYRHSTGSGALFYMIDALSQYGKVGMTCIGNSAQQAQQLFNDTVAVVDEEAHGGGHGVLSPLLDGLLPME